MQNSISASELQVKLLDYVKEKKGQRWDVIKQLLQDSNSAANDHPSSPGKPNLSEIKSTGETAFQRAIYNEKSITLFGKNQPGKNIKWTEIEIPVMLSNKARRKCVDLVGEMDGLPILCELKFKQRSSADSPEYAMIEILTYYYLLLLNHKNLDAQKVYHQNLGHSFRWDTLLLKAPFTLLVVANNEYWKYWMANKNKNNFNSIADHLREKTNLSILLVKSHDEDFSAQKGNKDTYKPKLESNKWEVIN